MSISATESRDNANACPHGAPTAALHGDETTRRMRYGDIRSGDAARLIGLVEGRYSRLNAEGFACEMPTPLTLVAEKLGCPHRVALAIAYLAVAQGDLIWATQPGGDLLPIDAVGRPRGVTS